MNFRRYDSHLLIRELCRTVKDTKEVRVIARNMQKYTAVFTSKFRFLDSYQHLSSSLDRLVEDLKTEGLDKFKNVQQYIETAHGGSEEKLNLCLRKGTYPYEFVTDMDQLKQSLPPKESFYSSLTEQHISEEDYKHVQNMWSTFNMETVGDLCKVCNSECIVIRCSSNTILSIFSGILHHGCFIASRCVPTI